MVVLIILSTYCAVENAPIIIDSTIYAMDFNTKEVTQLELNENIINFAAEEFLYILTAHHLYKIDIKNLEIVDNIPLPFRFNDLSIINEEIVLISMNEIVSLDKKHLSFKSGIGIERGDYYQIVSLQSSNVSGKNRYTYLINDTEVESIIKIFDLGSGKLIKKMSVPRVLLFTYDDEDNTLTTLDVNNNLILYDVQLNKKKVINLKFKGRSFTQCGDGYVVYNREGMFLVNNEGRLIDFQPLIIDENGYGDKFFFLVEDGIVHVDPLTFRIKKVGRVDKKLTRLFHIVSMRYIIVVDAENNFYILDNESLQLEPLAMRETLFKEMVSSTLGTDSLWYFQLGAFENHKNALAVYDSIRQNNIPAFIDSSDFYRIKLGGFKDKTSAMELIKRAHLYGWFIFQQKINVKGHEEFYVGAEKYIFEEGIIKKE